MQLSSESLGNSEDTCNVAQTGSDVVDAVLRASELWRLEIHDFEASQSFQDLENALIDNLLLVG